MLRDVMAFVFLLLSVVGGWAWTKPYLLNFRKDWQRAEQGDQCTLTATYIVFLRKVAICWLLEADKLWSSSGSTACVSCCWSCCFQHCLECLSLFMAPALSEQRSLQHPQTKPNLQSKVFILLPAGRFLKHLGPTRLWASCDGLRWFMTAPPCRQHPGSLWAL